MISWLDYKGQRPYFVTAFARITDSGEGYWNFGQGFVRSAMAYFTSTGSDGSSGSGSDSFGRTFTSRTGISFDQTIQTQESRSSSWSASWDGRPPTLELQTSTTALYMNEWGDTYEGAKIGTCETQTQTIGWTTKTTTNGTGTITQITTSTQNATILTTSTQTEQYTVNTTTTTRKLKVNNAGEIYDTIVQADEGEVLYVVEQGDLTFWKPSNTPFLTEIATTATRITLKWRPSNTTVAPSFVESFDYPSAGYTDETVITESYRRAFFSYSPATTTSTFYSGIVPTPTTTIMNYGQNTTTSDTYVKNYQGGIQYDGRFNLTVVREIYGKRPVIIKAINNIEDSPLITCDETFAVDVESSLLNGNGVNPAIIVTGPPRPPEPPSNRGETREYNMYVDIDVGPRYALKLGDYDNQHGIPNNTAISAGFAAYKAGVMTSPDSYYGRLVLSGTTLLIATVFSTGTSWGPNWQRDTTTATTTTNVNSVVTTTYRTRTTTFSPTYARFHRSAGGVALMPTSAGQYTANVSAVTYITGSGTNTSTTSETVSVEGSGITRLANRSLVGGAAGFEETIYGNVFGLGKINESKTFFRNATEFSSTTGSTGLASRIEFPAIVLTAETDAENAGPFFWVGGYSYMDILND